MSCFADLTTSHTRRGMVLTYERPSVRTPKSDHNWAGFVNCLERLLNSGDFHMPSSEAPVTLPGITMHLVYIPGVLIRLSLHLT